MKSARIGGIAIGSTRTMPGATPIEDRGDAPPEVLVSTDWVADHLNDPNVRLVESDEDVLLYETGHIPGAVTIDWVAHLNDPLVRDDASRDRLQTVLRSKGINTDATIVFYGDNNNCWACYSFWVLRLFGVENVRIMDGGRTRWAQEGRPLETTVPSYPPGNITVGDRDDPTIRAFSDDVVAHVPSRRPLVRRIGTLVARALRLRCPHCGTGRVFSSWFHMREWCPTCHLRLERGEEGYIVGAYMFNIIAAELLFALVAVAVVVSTWPSPPWTALQWGGAALMITVPLICYPFSKTLFLAVDLLFRPARPEDFPCPGATARR